MSRAEAPVIIPARRPTSAPGWQVDVIRGGPEIIETIAEDWRTLCREGRHDQPFFYPDWLAAHASCFTPHHHLILLTARNNGRLRAVLPLLQDSIHEFGWPLRRLRSIANRHSCRFDVVAAPGSEGDAAVAALWPALRTLPDWDVLALSLVPAGGAAEHFIAAARRNDFPVALNNSCATPFIPLSRKSDGTLSTPKPRSSKLHTNLRRWSRHLSSQGGLTLHRLSAADPAALRDFYLLEATGWKGRRGAVILQDPPTRAFYDRIARFAAAYGFLSLYSLALDGRTIATHFGLTNGSSYFVPKCAYDQSLSAHGPGHLLVQEVLKDCAASGLSEFDFLGVDEEWKLRWTSSVRIHNTWLVYRNHRLGRALHALRFRLKPALKHALHL